MAYKRIFTLLSGCDVSDTHTYRCFLIKGLGRHLIIGVFLCPFFNVLMLYEHVFISTRFFVYMKFMMKE
jgi:hypothetical protein